MTLQDFYDVLRLSIGSSGVQLQPTEYNNLIKKVNLQKWEKERALFEVDQRNMDCVGWLKKSATLTFTTGEADVPADYGTKASCLVGNIDVEFVRENEVGSLKSNSIYPPTATEPIMVRRGAKFNIIPSSVTSATLVYLKKFTESGVGQDMPKYSYKLEATDMVVYDPATSVEFGWPQTENMDLLNMMMIELGIIKQ